MDVCIFIATPIISSFNGDAEVIEFSVIREPEVFHHLRSNIPMIKLAKAMKEFFYLKGLRLSKMK
jgi:hypothetical protein